MLLLVYPHYSVTTHIVIIVIIHFSYFNHFGYCFALLHSIAPPLPPNCGLHATVATSYRPCLSAEPKQYISRITIIQRGRSPPTPHCGLHAAVVTGSSCTLTATDPTLLATSLQAYNPQDLFIILSSMPVGL